MAEERSVQELFELWKKQVEDGVQAWSKALGQSQAFDPAGAWRPLVDPSMGAWSKLATQGPVTPDVLAQWKQFLDQCLAAWGKALEQAMGTEAFARALGAYVDRWLAPQGPLKQAAGQSAESALSALELPSRAQVAGIARRQKDLEDRIEALGDRLESCFSALMARLETPRGAAAPPAGASGAPDSP